MSDIFPKNSSGLAYPRDEISVNRRFGLMHIYLHGTEMDEQVKAQRQMGGPP